MSIRIRTRRITALATAALTTLTAAILGVSATPAHAIAPCPNVSVEDITTWLPVFNSKGVVLCRGTDNSGNRRAEVQMIDFTVGAKIRIVSTVVTGTRNQCDGGTGFQPRTAAAWYDGLAAGSFISNPLPGQLFSTTNAAFFINTSGTPTAISMPEKTGGSVSTAGYVVNGPSNCKEDRSRDDAWSASKRMFGVSTVATNQSALVQAFPTHYTTSDVANYSLDCWECVVGFYPTYHNPDTDVDARRTFVGRTSGHAYILTTVGLYTETEANNIISAFATGMLTVQLDGGRSTQMESRTDSDDVLPISGRKVPDVLAVYTAL